MPRRVKVPVLVKMGDQIEGPVKMTVEEGPVLFHSRTRDMYAIRNPPTVIERNGRRRIGYVVGRESASTLVYDHARGVFAPPVDETFSWAPWVRSALAVRAQNAQGEAADMPLWMKVLLGFGGFAAGAILYGLVNAVAGGMIGL